MSMPYQPPLRSAVRWLVERLPPCARFSAATLAVLSQAAESRAVAYCSILVGQKALQVDGDGYGRAAGWDAWAARPYRTRPKKGGSVEEDAMCRLRRVLCKNLEAERERQGLSPMALAHKAGVNHSYILKAEKYCEPPSACALVLIAAALGVTIEQLCVPGASLAPVG